MLIGSRIGTYEVLAKLGEGGMGEVYRAKDSRLKREIALKVLPPSVAQDAERLARFQREAEVLASLNHPHIAQIYGIEEGGGTTALVMELVDGEDLAQRIARGSIELDEAVALSKQITQALAAAHDAGIVHRDLKPANIKVRPDGTVKVLDFGLAKALDTAPSGVAMPPPEAATVTSPAMPRLRQGYGEAGTEIGVILGTAAYMAPEQARGRPVDKRADIWAFGCVFYEMLTGERLFRGEAMTDVLASVIKDQPAVSKAPASVRRLLNSCLEKDPRDRLRDIGDVWALVAEGDRGLPAAPSRLPWAIAAALALLAGILGVVVLRRAGAAPAAPPLVQFQLPIAEEAGAVQGIMSPDGRRIAYSSGNRMWVRDLGALPATPLPEADAIVTQPFWSADSRALLFSSAGVLKQADGRGGPAQTICTLAGTLAGGFTVGDRVVFSTSPGGVRTVPLAGGNANPVPMLTDDSAYVLRDGALLADHDHFVFGLAHSSEERRGIYVASLTGGEPPKRLLPDSSAVTYVPSPAGTSGSLIFIRGGALMAQPFNPRTLELNGEPSRIVENVRSFSASASGSIVYRSDDSGRRLTWMDRQGNTVGTVGAPDQHQEVALSRDGSQAAVVRRTRAYPSTWVFDLARESSRRLPSIASEPRVKPVWLPDGKTIIVVAPADVKASSLLRLRSDGSGAAERLFMGEGLNAPRDVSPDGKWLLYVSTSLKTTREDLWLLSLLPGEHKPEPFLVTDYIETDGMFSPDGRFVAYVSNESGGFELWVRSFPVTAGGKWRISNGGGYQPRWRRDGRELFFFTTDGRLMSTEITLAPVFRAGITQTLFRAPIFGGGATTTNHYWDVSPDGQRFLINTTSTNDESSKLTVVLNWQSGSSPASRK